MNVVVFLQMVKKVLTSQIWKLYVYNTRKLIPESILTHIYNRKTIDSTDVCPILTEFCIYRIVTVLIPDKEISRNPVSVCTEVSGCIDS